jgi:hypothetical protein
MPYFIEIFKAIAHENSNATSPAAAFVACTLEFKLAGLTSLSKRLAEVVNSQTTSQSKTL